MFRHPFAQEPCADASCPTPTTACTLDATNTCIVEQDTPTPTGCTLDATNSCVTATTAEVTQPASTPPLPATGITSGGLALAAALLLTGFAARRTARRTATQ